MRICPAKDKRQETRDEIGILEDMPCEIPETKDKKKQKTNDEINTYILSGDRQKH